MNRPAHLLQVASKSAIATRAFTPRGQVHSFSLLPFGLAGGSGRGGRGSPAVPSRLGARYCRKRDAVRSAVLPELRPAADAGIAPPSPVGIPQSESGPINPRSKPGTGHLKLVASPRRPRTAKRS